VNYLDANFAAALHFNIRGQTSVAGRFVRKNSLPFIFSELAELECRRAFIRRTGEPRSENWLRLQSLVAGGAWHRAPLDWRTVLQRSNRLVDRFGSPLGAGTLDTLHVAHALLTRKQAGIASNSVQYAPRMALPSGSRVGPYEIVDLLGAGGMGEVYRARDTRLDRLVALKILSDALAGDVSARTRFEREAKAISALNHPHICALHDIGRADNTDFLVLELLGGETLAGRLTRGALPLAQVLRIGSEIADALGAAHRQGIVHRDLKPANIMLTPAGVKLLDFGLAKPHPIQMSAGVTVAHTSGATAQGTIVGTLQYMAPEQLQGLETDARTDIFALGAMLYEMATGRLAFEAQSQASLIARILDTDPPPMSTLVPLAPPAFEQLVQRCLSKEPAERWQSAHDLALQLRWMQAQVSGTSSAPAPGTRRARTRVWVPWSVAAVLGVIAVVAVLWPRTDAIDPPPMRLEVHLPAAARLDAPDGPVVSPDGRWLAYTATTVESGRQLFYTDLLSQQTVALPGTDGAYLPFWSPDSRGIGFFAGASLKQVSLDVRQPRTVAPAPVGRGGTWGPGFILFAPTIAGVIHRVPDTGGRPEPLQMPPPPEGGGYVMPHLLPDGRSFVVWERGRSELHAVSLDDPGRLKTVETGDMLVAQHQAGHLVYRRGTTLGARPFDVRRLEFSGPFVPLAENALMFFSISTSGTIVYRSEAPRPRQLTWFDRNGARIGTVGEPGDIVGLGMAASGRRAAVWRNANGNVDLWHVDLASGITSRLTSDPGQDTDAAWSPDERTLAFSAQRGGRFAVYLKHLVDGKEELLAQHPNESLVVDTWTPDGKFVVARTVGRQVFLIPLTGDRTPRLLVDTPYIEDELKVSSDGRWVAFNSDESGRWEVYVAAFPDFTFKRQVSAAGGVQPHWGADGRELFFLSLSGSMMSVRVTPGPELMMDPPSVLFTTNIEPNANLNQYAVTPDGKRFLTLDRGEHRAHTFTFLLNALRPGMKTSR
jgi:eukaryotic-like serine/threonine-protein kinase